MLRFTDHSMLHIQKTLASHLASLNAKEELFFEVINPDVSQTLYNGSSLLINGTSYRYHSLKTWQELAQILHCRMYLPIYISETHIRIRYAKLHTAHSFHASSQDAEHKYGADSLFAQIHKMQEPSFVHYYTQALKNVNIDKRLRILNLGVNSGDEFELIRTYSDAFDTLELLGIDYCASAIEKAKENFKEHSNVSFLCHDIKDLASLDIAPFDLIISIGTLQSSNLEFNPLVMSLVQNHLKADGAMILAFPNCRWMDGEMVYGAHAKHYAFSEMSHVYKDAIFCKKYLQQKKFRVSITGKDYIFVTATSIRKS